MLHQVCYYVTSVCHNTSYSTSDLRDVSYLVLSQLVSLRMYKYSSASISSDCAGTNWITNGSTSACGNVFLSNYIPECLI